MQKKTIRLLLGFIMMSSVLAGCGGGKKSEPAKTTTAAGAPETAEGTDSGKISSEDRTLKVLIKDSTNQPLKNGTVTQEAIYEATGIKVELQIVPDSDYTAKLSTLLATNKIPDIVYLNSPSYISQNASTGIFLELSQYLDQMPDFKKIFDQYPEMKKAMIGDKLYAFQMVGKNEATNGMGVVLRTDLLKKNNLTLPVTFDELLDVLEKLKALYPDSVPITMRNGAKFNEFKTTAYMLGSGPELYYDYDVNGGSFVFGPAAENFKEVLKFYRDAYSKGLLDPDFASSTTETFQSKLISGKALCFIDNSGFSIDYTNLLKQTDPDAELKFIPYLKNSFGQTRAISYETEVNSGRYFAVRGDVKDPETVVKFMNWLYSEKGSDITNYGKEGVTFQYNDKGKPEFIKDYVMRFKDESPAYYKVFADAGITKLNFCLWAGNTQQNFEISKMVGQWSDFADEYWADAQSEVDKGVLKQPVSKPPLSEADTEKANEILMDLNTYLEQQYNKFIIGEAPIDDWDDVIKTCEELGAHKLEEIYNHANEGFQ